MDYSASIRNQLLFSAQYRITAAAFTKCSPQWRDTRFTPEFNRFYLIMDGEGMVELSGKRYFPKPGQLFFLPAAEVQSYATISDHTFLKYWVHFTAKTGGLQLFSLLRMPVFANIASLERTVRKFEALIEAFRDTAIRSAFRQQSLLFDIISDYTDHFAPDQFQLYNPEMTTTIEAMLSFIDARLSEAITVDQLAEQFHYHPNHVIRMFKQLTGFSPIRYLIRRRMDVAKLRLSASNRTIAEISEEIGLEPHYFSRVFKEETGFTPSDYRKMTGAVPRSE